MTTTPTASPELLDLDALRKIGSLITTQDNRITDQPMFIVQQRRRMYGLDTGYCDNFIWLCSEDEYNEASAEEADALEAEYQDTGRAKDGWQRTGYIDQWEFVTACFTEQGCIDYLKLDGHNLNEPRIYAEGSYRNEEFRAVRNSLIALARRAQPYATGGDVPGGLHLAGEGLRPLCGQPESEATQAAPLSEVQIDRIARAYFSEQWAVQHAKDAIHDAFQDARKSASLWPLCGAQPAESGKETAQLSIGFANNDQGVHVSVMQQHAGGAVTLLHQAKVPAGDSFARFAIDAQQATAPGALDADEMTRLRRLMAALGHSDAFELTDDYVRGILCTLLGQAAGELERASLAAISSAPGTPEALARLMQALTTGIPLQEPVHITKALRAQREVRVSLAGGTGPGAAAFLVNIQMTPWAHTKETAEAFAYGYNRALKEYRAALLDVAAQLDGGQEGSESNADQA